MSFRFNMSAVFLVGTLCLLLSIASAESSCGVIVSALNMSGSYLCPQGETLLNLSVTVIDDACNVSALFTFISPDDGCNGTYNMSGFELTDGTLTLTPDVWLDNPCGYTSIGLDGVLLRERNSSHSPPLDVITYNGTIPSTPCDGFLLTGFVVIRSITRSQSDTGESATASLSRSSHSQSSSVNPVTLSMTNGGSSPSVEFTITQSQHRRSPVMSSLGSLSLASSVGVASILLMVVGAPASITQAALLVPLQVSLSATRNARRCANYNAAQNDSEEDDDPPGSSLLDNPLQLNSVASSSDENMLTPAQRFAAGCVVGNFIVVVMASIVCEMVATVWEHRGTIPLHSASQTVKTIAVHFSKTVPSSGSVIIMALLQPSVTCIIVLLSTPPVHASTMAVGIFGVLCVACVTGTVLHGSWAQLLLLKQDNSDKVMLLRSSDPQHPASPPSWQRLNGVFDGYKVTRRWYASIDVSIALVCGVLAALPPVNGCGSSSWVPLGFLVVTSISTIAVIALRPCSEVSDIAVSIVTNVCTVIVIVLCILNDETTAATMTAVLAWVCLVPLVIGLGKLFVEGVMKIGSNKDEKGEEQKEGTSERHDACTLLQPPPASTRNVRDAATAGRLVVKYSAPPRRVANHIQHIVTLELLIQRICQQDKEKEDEYVYEEPFTDY